MIGRIVTCDEEIYQLPPLLECSVCCTGGVPCDSFSAVCVYTPDMADIAHKAVSMQIWHGEKLLLHGVVDEYVISQSDKGQRISFQGRGLACRLLDNESRPVSYQAAGLEEILRNHVALHGITCRTMADVRAVGTYSVSAGSSQWKALMDFCEIYGGFVPRFARSGELLAVPEENTAIRKIDASTTILSLEKRENHYGVLSEVVVMDKTRGVSYTVKNQDFIQRGGQRRQVVYTPGQSSWALMRYTGEYRIAKSRKKEVEITLTLPGIVEADPADTVVISRDECGIYGTYRVAEVEHRLGSDGELTLLTLEERV